MEMKLSELDIMMETFFVNSVWKDHKVSQTGKDHYFIVKQA